MSAVDEYKTVRHDINHGGFPPFSGEQMSRIRDAADAAIAELEAERKRFLDSSQGAYYVRLADAIQRAEQAEAEVERLRVCGNCTLRYDSPPRISWDGHECGSHWNGVDGDWDDEDNWPMVKCGDPCHFTLSRWAERETP